MTEMAMNEKNLETPLTRLLGIRHPILSAPMAWVAGGHLASAVSEAGGLGLIGGATVMRNGLSGNWPARLIRPLALASSPGA